jgi:LCP family protein required for cell wall assembly
MKRFIHTIKQSPKSPTMILGYWAFLGLMVLLTFIGYFQIGRSLVSGERTISFLPGLTSGGKEKEDVVPAELPRDVEEGLPEPVEMPAGVMETWDGEGRVTVLVMGLDYRDWSAGSGPSRTDTMMLLTMDPLSNSAGILSIPRDLWVSIPGFENNRINVAYFLGEAYKIPGGGPAMAIKTVEALLGIRINYYAVVDFGAFVRFVDELGGVKIDVPASLRIDPIVGPPKILQPGRQTLPGELALAYARARNTPNGDLDRALRQQQVVYGIRDRLVKPESLSDLIAKAPALYGEISSGVRTNMTLDEAIRLAWLAQKVPDDQIRARAISPSDVSYANTPDGRSVLLPRTEKIRQLRDDIFLISPGTLGPLSPGSDLERMAREGAEIRLINGTGDEALGERAQEKLSSQGANILEVILGQVVNGSRILDYTGNPHTVEYFMQLLGLSPGSHELRYDPESEVDVEIVLGLDNEDGFATP